MGHRGDRRGVGEIDSEGDKPLDSASLGQPGVRARKRAREYSEAETEVEESGVKERAKSPSED